MLLHLAANVTRNVKTHIVRPRLAVAGTAREFLSLVGREPVPHRRLREERFLEDAFGGRTLILDSRRLFFGWSQGCAVARPLLIGVGWLVQEAEGAAEAPVPVDLTLDSGPGKNEASRLGFGGEIVGGVVVSAFDFRELNQ
jgi:hypothetical protein